MSVRIVVLGVTVGLVSSGCALFRSTRGSEPSPEIHFDPLTITGDLELEKLNDEELFAAASSYFAAEDYLQAARYFGRIADFHPASIHRRPSLYNSGLALEKLKHWEDARARFAELADPQRGTGDSLDAAFRVAETLYHLERYDEAGRVLDVIAKRKELSLNKRLEAMVQKGVCELESGQSDLAEATLRRSLTLYQELEDKGQVDDYFPAQAQFFLGEVFRLHFESIHLDPERGTDQLAKDLEYKAELLLSAQGHYLRSIRIGNGYWATAAGTQIGGLYEKLYDHMVQSPAPKELNREEGEVYRQELRKKIRVLITKAISIYERTLEAAERIGASSPFVEKTRESLKKMKDLLLADAQADDEAPHSTPSKNPDPGSRAPTAPTDPHA